MIAARLLQAAALAAMLADVAEGFRVEAPSGPVLLGRRFELVVRGPLEPGDRLAADAPGAGLSAGEPGLLEGADGRELRWSLRALGEGEFTLTGLAVEREGQRHALADVPVTVVLDLPPGQLPEVAAPLPPVRVPWSPADLRPFLLGVPLALLLLALLVARASRPVPAPKPAPRPPELVAAQALANLRGRLPRTRDEVPAFVVEVSGVLRTYIEERFALRAPERTTEEFLPLAAAHPALAGQRGMLGGFLHQCDLVKFAGLRPDPAGMPEVLAAAERFVDTTGGLPATPAEAAA